MSVGVIGIPDPGIWLAYVLCLASTVLCVVYGIIRGRNGGETNGDRQDKA